MKVVEGRGVEEGDKECVIQRENEWVPPEQIKTMTSSHGKEQGIGWQGIGGRESCSDPFCLSGPILWKG